MGSIVCGRVGDRPWGQTLAALWTRRATGQLTVTSGGKRYAIAFADGMIVGATSPLTADSIARIALTQHLVIASQVQAIVQRIAAAPDRDEIAVLAEVSQLSKEQLEKLRTRVLVQRAARTFALDDGEFELDEHVQIPKRGAADVAEVLFVGARQFLAQDRLAGALNQLGGRFALSPSREIDLARFGFGASERPILEALTRGTSLPEIEAHHREIDPRAAYAVVYALATWGALQISGGGQVAPTPAARISTPDMPAIARTATPTIARTATPTIARTATPTVARTSTSPAPPRAPTSQPVTARTSTMQPATFRQPTSQPAAPRAPTSHPAAPRAPTSPPPTARTTTSPIPATARTTTSPVPRASTNVPPATRASTSAPPATRVPTTIPPPVGRAPTPPQDQDWPIASRTTSTRRTALAGRELELIVARKAHLIGAHADHFTLLGVPPDAAPDTVSSALALLERQLAPDRLAELRLESLATEAVRVLEHLRAAAAVLIDPAKRAAYRANPSGAPPDPAAEAKAAYRRAELLMRSDRLEKAVVELDRACELAPDDITYRAARAWARFCAASDKAAIADETRKLLHHAAMHSETPEIPRFWLGRVERILGREREALRHFQAVLELQPGHKDATSEVRILEARFRR